MTAHQLAGRAVLITGAASGVGRETARRLAGVGASLALLDRDATALEALVGELGGARGRILTEVLDVTDADETERVVSRAWGALGALDIALNCAGILRLGQWDRLSVADYRTSMDVNFFGTMHVAQAILPHMRRRGQGHLIHMSSIAGLHGMPHFAAYSASKFAVFGFSQALRHELEGTGIAVSVVCPPSIRTPMVTNQATLPPIYHRFPWLTPETVAKRIIVVMESRHFLETVDARTRALLLVNRLFPWVVDRLIQAWSR